MTTNTDHSNCRHPRTSAGRAACRRAGGPAAFDFEFRISLRAEAEAVCPDCFSLALEVAAENLIAEGTATDASDTEVLVQARDYLFDRSALTACTAHQTLL